VKQREPEKKGTVRPRPVGPARRFAVAVLPALLTLLASRAAAWNETDARTLARGGISALDRLDHSPGAPVPRGFVAQAGGVWHFLGSGLVAQGLHVGRTGGRLAWSFGIDWLRSDLHREQEIASAVQLRRHRLRLGITLGWREWQFARHAPWRRPLRRLGIGARPQARVQVVGMGEPVGGGAQALRFTACAEIALEKGIDAAFQVEREPALPIRLRASLGWRPAEPLEFRCGYDAATSSLALGVIVRSDTWSGVCAAATHPELGWSRAWLLEWRR